MDSVASLSILSSLYGRTTALTEDEKKYIEQLYNQTMPHIFKRREGCSDCYRDALIELQLKIKRIGMDKQQYLLKNGVVLYFHSTGNHYTNNNITDKIAKEYLEKHPDGDKFFAQLPESSAVAEPVAVPLVAPKLVPESSAVAPRKKRK